MRYRQLILIDVIPRQNHYRTRSFFPSVIGERGFSEDCAAEYFTVLFGFQPHGIYKAANQKAKTRLPGKHYDT